MDEFNSTIAFEHEGDLSLYDIKTAEIIASGSEILSGMVCDTNSSFLALALAELGIDCRYISAVGDREELFSDLLRRAFARSDLVICTGGLGPTDDDMSMRLAAEALGLPLTEREEARRHVLSYFERVKRPCPENNFKQCLFPEGAIILDNPLGTACGAFGCIRADGRLRYYALLPGPPKEMKSMFRTALRPLLTKHSGQVFMHRSFRCFGLGESAAEMRCRDLIRADNGFTIATYIGNDEVLLRLSALVSREEAASGDFEARFEALSDTLKERLSPYLFEIGPRHLPECVLDRLRKAGLRAAFAESCTAGLLTAALGRIPGASEVLEGGIISYSNEVKEQLLRVPETLLSEHGAVSEACACAMAEGLLKSCPADLTVSVTGIAGPGGGSEEKPVGTVWIGLAHQDHIDAELFHLTGTREQIQNRAVMHALDRIRRYLDKLEL